MIHYCDLVWVGWRQGGEFLSSYRIIYAFILPSVEFRVLSVVPTADDGGWKDSNVV